MLKPNLISVGDNCLDVYLTWGDMAIGGNALNVAMYWHRLGADSRYFGAVGQDGEGEHILSIIKEGDLEPSDVEILKGSSAVSLIVHEAGERRFLLESLGVGENYFPKPSHYQDLTRCDFVHLGTHPNPQLLQRLSQDRVRFSVDLSNHGFEQLDLSAAELVLASGGDAPSIPAQIEKIKQKGGRKILITCGAQGAYYYEEGQTSYAPARNIEIFDTCGAGDSFLACFVLSKFFCGMSVQESLEDATNQAAMTCTHQGSFIQNIYPIPQWLYEKYAQYIPEKYILEK